MALPNGPYDPKQSEEEILNFWLDNKLYKPEYNPEVDKVQTTEEMKSDPRESWSLICPPPNAYARPHIGNISGYAYQDAIARYARMNGKKVLVIPGKDHAGLEGEGVFVREVLEKQGRNKFDMTRDEFYKEMWEFFQKNMDIAMKDEKSIGLSADYDRDTFTLDPEIVEIVLDTFVEMYNDGMIYKGVRLVNWDPKARTAVADNQIEYKDAITPFVYFKYGFVNPEQKALDIKKEFQNKSIEWSFERNKTKDGQNELPFAFGHYSKSEAEVTKEIEGNGGIEIIGIGYSKEIQPNSFLKGNVVGIQMRLDNMFRIVVLNEDHDAELNLQDELNKIFLFEIKHYAGAHIILFDQYPEDKYYTNGFILATVRPETKFGDTAIAVDPKDERYKKFVGKTVEVKTLNGVSKLNIISDYAVEKDFGTGIVKITPAHSPVDWEIAQRHPQECLPAKQVIGYDLRLNHLTGKYSGMNIKEARPVIMEDMKKEGMLIYVDETYQNRIQIAERTKAPIEPLLSSQWYLKYDGIKEAATEMVNGNLTNDEAVKSNTTHVDIYPNTMVPKFNHWMENLRDWAISRSLWWGYRLPVWYAGKIEEKIDQNGQVKELITINGSQLELDYSNPSHLRVQKENPGEGWLQDESVLDTWFSSGQWVYATLTKYNLMDTFFPTDVLVSASDILENWDSRMMMFTYFKYKNIPFKNLFLTGLVLGSDGQKMSKSKGNIVDMDKIKTEFGTDSIRMSYFYQNSAGGSYVISNDKLKNFKQFNNKIWNATKFVLMHTDEILEFKSEDLELISDISNLKEDFSKTLVMHITELKAKITKNIDNYEFGYATETLYDEFWHTFCDKYIEESKVFVQLKNTSDGEESKNDNTRHSNHDEVALVMLYVLKEYLKMLHPFIPFITEKIWQEMPRVNGDHKSLMYSKW